jgi:hypothetical protein
VLTEVGAVALAVPLGRGAEARTAQVEADRVSSLRQSDVSCLMHFLSCCPVFEAYFCGL